MALLLLLLLGAVVTVPLGERLGLPAPVLMTLAGIAMAFASFVPDVDIPPEIILPALLPPLLYASVQRTSWRQFAANKRPIFLLAVALVFVTTAAVATVANAVVPGLPIAAAVALGALVAPPDPVAATAVAGSVGLPRRLVSILEGEGLFNDVTAIVLYHVAIAAAVSGTFSLPEAFGLLVLSAVVAVVVGLVLGWLTIKLMGLLGDATLQVGLTLLVPFVSYVLAEELMGSGVLAVLTTALFLAEHTADADDVLGRLTGRSFWEIVDTLVTGVAFGLIGLELHSVFGTADGRELQFVGWGLAIVAVVVGVRLLWLLAGHLARQAAAHPPRLQRGDPHQLARDRRHVVGGDARRGLGGAGPGDPAGDGRRETLPRPRRDHLRRVRRDHGHTGVPGPDPAVAGAQARGPGRHGRGTGPGTGTRDPGGEGGQAPAKEIEGVEDFPEEVQERLQRAAYDIGARISPDMVDDERREAYAQRAERFKAFGRVQRELLSAARHEVLSARSEPGSDPEVVDRVLRYLDVRSLR